MKIGYVLKQFPKLSETFVLNEMRALERQGAEIHVFAMAPGADAHFHAGLAELAAPVTYIGTGRSSAFLQTMVENQELIEARWSGVAPMVWDLIARGPAVGKRPLDLLRASADLFVRAEPLALDRLHAHFAGPAAEVARLAAAALKIPYGFTCHAKDIYHQSASANSFRTLHASADRVITVCAANHAFLEKQVIGRPSSKLIVAYNGVSMDKFHNKNRRPAPKPTVLAVGRLVAKKGFNVLVDAAAILERRGVDFSVEIIGDGREEESLRQQVGRLGVTSVNLSGPATQDYVRARMAEAWVVALPCIVDNEGNRDALPTVLLEALASGIPSVSTPVTGVAEIITHEREGLLVPENDPTSLANALSRLLADADLRRAMGIAARAKAEDRFDLDRNAATLLETWGRSAHLGAVNTGRTQGSDRPGIEKDLAPMTVLP